jgi:phenylalanyl-tRNA synthetase beta chain
VRNTDTTVEGFHQPMRVAGLAYGPADSLQWGRTEQGVDFFDVKGDVEALLAPLQASFEPGNHPSMHPGRCARVVLNGRAIGFVGELHPQSRQAWDLPQAPLMFELDLDAVLARSVPVFKPVAKQQAVERDLAVVVAERVTHADVMAAVHEAVPGDLLRSAVLFDVYRPKPLRDGEAAPAAAQVGHGEKSLAVRLTLGRDEATLTEAEIESAVQLVVAQLKERTGARLRV